MLEENQIEKIFGINIGCHVNVSILNSEENGIGYSNENDI